MTTPSVRYGIHFHITSLQICFSYWQARSDYIKAPKTLLLMQLDLNLPHPDLRTNQLLKIYRLHPQLAGRMILGYC